MLEANNFLILWAKKKTSHTYLKANSTSYTKAEHTTQQQGTT